DGIRDRNVTGVQTCVFRSIRGTYYWYSKWKRLTTENISITPKKTVTYLRKLKVVNIWILILAVIAVIIDISMYYPSLPMAGLIEIGRASCRERVLIVSV